MKKVTFSLTLFSIIALSAFSQQTDWRVMMKDGKASVHDIQKAFYGWYANHKKDVKPLSGKEQEDCNYTLFKRWEYMMEPRTYPSGNYPDPKIISTAYANMVTQHNDKRKQAEKTASTANWTYEGNANVPNYGGDGRINHVRFYPGNSNTMFACAPTGGLWKSSDGGNTWASNTDQLSELGTSDIAIDPTNPNVMYLATGDCDGPRADFHSISTIGILKTTDGGATWNPTGLSYAQAATGPSYGTISELAINPNNTNIILAATSNGMYYTTNAGTSWTQADTEYFRSVELEPFHPSVVYASTWNGKFFRSTDGGMTYTQITTGLPGAGLCARTTIAVTPADSNYVYVVFGDAISDSYYGLYLSTDRGQTFTQQSNSGVGSLSVSYDWYGLPLAVSPTNVDSVLTGGLDVYLSTDKGKTWNINASWTGSGAPYAHADGHHYTFLPGNGAAWFDACDGGIFKATKGGKFYTDLSNNLQIAEIYALGASSLTPGMWLTGWQDNGTNLSGAPWTEVNGGDGMVPFIDYTNDNTMYSATEDGALYISTNGGGSWNGITSGINENGPWVTRWLQDPKAPNTLFAGYSNIWMSTNQGTSWSKISNFSTTSALVNALVVDPVNDMVLYTAWKDSAFMTTNQGATWKNITSTLPVSQAWITSLALDQNNYKHAWVAFSGYVDSVKVFQTYDGGSTWKNISSGLPNLPVNCLLFQNSSNGGIYAGTDCGIYYRDTISNSWISYNTGLPNVMVNDIKFDANGDLLAATYGRGVWTSPRYVLGVNNLTGNNSDGEVKVYPNPSNGLFTVEISGVNSKASIEVYNMLGEKILTTLLNSSTGSSSKTLITPSGGSISSGVYLYRVIEQSGATIATGKLIIQ